MRRKKKFKKVVRVRRTNNKPRTPWAISAATKDIQNKIKDLTKMAYILGRESIKQEIKTRF